MEQRGRDGRAVTAYASATRCEAEEDRRGRKSAERFPAASSAIAFELSELPETF